MKVLQSCLLISTLVLVLALQACSSAPERSFGREEPQRTMALPMAPADEGPPEIRTLNRPFPR